MKISLITGDEPHYQIGLASGLAKRDLLLEVIGDNELASAAVMRDSRVRFWNLRPHIDPTRPAWQKLLEVIRYYLRLMLYASRTDSDLFHVQWPYKFPFFDRTLLNLWYKIWGKKIVFTAHNVDQGARDGTRSWKNTLGLRFQYWLMDHIIVHTAKMKAQLVADFATPEAKISVIPHGINCAVPESCLERDEARAKLNLPVGQALILFFGRIDRYKGLDHLVSALAALRRKGQKITLLVAGKIKGNEEYWKEIRALIDREGLAEQVVVHQKYISDEQIELYFKAADVLVLPYREIFQSGVLFLAFRFGLPVIATDVGSFKEDIVNGVSGFLCRPDDPADLARAIETYFASELFKNLATRRKAIRDYASEKYSWTKIGVLTQNVYEQVTGSARAHRQESIDAALPGGPKHEPTHVDQARQSGLN